MKRCWVGAGMLAFLLGAGILATLWMDSWHGSVAREIRMAGDAAYREDWDRALTLSGDARKRWEDGWGISAALADHELMEQINGLFDQLAVYGRARDKTAYAAVCAQLGAVAEALADSQSMRWWNLL